MCYTMALAGPDKGGRQGHNMKDVTMALARGPRDGICMARQCSQAATHVVEWVNPRSVAGRTVTWLTCENHIDFYHGYFRYRNFPYTIRPIEPGDTPTDA